MSRGFEKDQRACSQFNCVLRIVTCLVVFSSALALGLIANVTNAYATVTPATSPVRVASVEKVDPTFAIGSIDCTSSSFCMAVDADSPSNYLTFNGSSWTVTSTALSPATPLAQVSCISTTSCFATENKLIYEYIAPPHTPAWFSVSISPAPATNFSSISCVNSGAGFCVAVGATGELYEYNGTAWSQGTSNDTNSFTGVSCVSSTFCMAVDSSGNTDMYNGTIWTLTAAPVPAHTPAIVPTFTSVSCPLVDYCVAVTSTVDTAGTPATDMLYYVYSSNGTSSVWSYGQSSDTNPMESVSCPLEVAGTVNLGTFCMASDNPTASSSSILFFNGSSWSSPSVVDSTSAIAQLSCISPTACYGVDGSGDVISVPGQSWAYPLPWSPNPVDSGHALNTISCVAGASAFCASGDSAGNIYLTSNGTSWSDAIASNDTNPINSISCTSSTFCMQTDSLKNFDTYNGTAWGVSLTATGLTNPLTSLSCGSSTMCVGADGTSTTPFSVIYSGGVWGAWTAGTAGTGAYNAVSCASSSFCIAVGNSGIAATYAGSGTTWAAISAVDANNFVAVSCASATFCLAVDNLGNAYSFVYAGATWTETQETGAKIDTNGAPALDSVSCLTGPPSEYCVAADGTNGDTYVDIGGIWSQAEAIDSGTSSLDVSCVGLGYCFAVDNGGNILELGMSPPAIAGTPTVTPSGSGSLLVAWTAPSPPGGFGGITSGSYVVSEINESTTPISQENFSSATPSYTASSLTKGDSYVFCVSVTTIIGESLPSCAPPATVVGNPGGVVIVAHTSSCTVGSKPTALASLTPVPSNPSGNGYSGAFADMGPFYLCITDPNGYVVQASSNVTVGFFAFNNGNFASGTIFSGSPYGPPLPSVGGLDSVTVPNGSAASGAVYFGTPTPGSSYTVWANAPNQFSPQCGLGSSGYGCAIVNADVQSAPSALGSLSVVVAPNTAASSATYTINFTATTALSTSDYYLIDGSSGAAGTVFPSVNTDYTITDLTNASGSGFAGATPTPYNAGATVAIAVPAPVSAGDEIQITITNVTNPSTPGTADFLYVYTSQDGIPTATNKYSIGAGSTMTIVSGNNQSTGLDQAFGSVLEVVVKNASGVVQPNIPVTFTAPSTGATGTFQASGSYIETDNTNASGIAASSIFTSNSTGGTYTIIGTAPGVSSVVFAMTNGSNQAISTINSALVASPSVVAANGITPSLLTVTLVNGSKVPVSGKTITISASSGTSAAITAINATTNSNGQATFDATDTVAETVIFSASDTSDSVTVNEQAQVTFTETPVVTVSPSQLSFNSQPVGTKSASQTVTFQNSGGESLSIFNITVEGPDQNDFTISGTNCTGTQLGAGSKCSIFIEFTPVGTGNRTSSLEIFDNSVTSPQIITATGIGTAATSTPTATGYWLAESNGQVTPFKAAGNYGSASNLALAAPIVGMAANLAQTGYWLAGADGGVFTYGSAHFYGSAGGLALVAPVVGIAATPVGHGYWLVASDGGIFSYGSAIFYGSMGGKTLAAPVVGMAATPDGRGYWEVAADGGIFSFGDASFEGSAGGGMAAANVVGMAPTQDGLGYWIVDSQGNVYNFGDATYYGQPSGVSASAIASTPDSKGYWIVTTQGQVITYGDAGFGGDLSTSPPSYAVIAIVPVKN